MKELTKHMIKEFRLKELGHDFMGYSLQKGDIYTFHHLVIPSREGGKYERENGSILCGKSAHSYLHVIEFKDYDIFLAIRSAMICMNLNGYIDKENIRYIDDCLSYFEREFSGARTCKGKPLIKDIYTNRTKY